MVQPGIASQSEVIRAIVLLGERIASQSEVIRAIGAGFVHDPIGKSRETHRTVAPDLRRGVAVVSEAHHVIAGLETLRNPHFVEDPRRVPHAVAVAGRRE